MVRQLVAAYPDGAGQEDYREKTPRDYARESGASTEVVQLLLVPRDEPSEGESIVEQTTSQSESAEEELVEDSSRERVVRFG